MNQIQDVTVDLFVNNELRSYDEDGFVGRLSKGNKVQLQVRIVPSNNKLYVVFNLQNDRKTGGTKVLGKKSKSEVDGEGLYIQTVNIKQNDRGVCYTDRSQNNLCVMTVDNNGSFCLYTIGLISQSGNFFLTQQMIYDGECYEHEGQFVCPRFMLPDKKRPELSELLYEIVYSNDLKLPPLDEYEEVPEVDAENLATRQARVLWWNEVDMMGLAAVPMSVSQKGLARIHWTQLPKRSKNGRAYLQSGEVVSFSGTRSPHQGLHFSALDCELLGVQPL